MGEADEAEGVKNSSARPSDSSRSMGINGTFDPSTLDTLKSRSRKSRKEEWDNNCTDIDDILNGGVDETALGDDATVVYDSGGSHSDENVRRVSEWSRRSCFRKSYWKTGGGPRRSWLKFQPDKKQLRLCRDALAESLKGVYAFNFQKRHARLDWRMLHAIDVDQILRDTDIDKLEAVLDTIAFGNIIEEDTRNFTESNFIKIFRLSQLMVEYLLHVQEILVAHKTKLMEAGLELQNQGENYRNRCALQEEALVQARRELKQLKKTVSTYEALLRSKEAVPTPASVPVFPPQPPTPWQAHHCPFCDKVFETVVYLLKTETEALQNEVQRLRAASQNPRMDKSERLEEKKAEVAHEKLRELEVKFADFEGQIKQLAQVSALKSEKQRFISSLDQRDEQMDELQKEIQKLRRDLEKDSGQQDRRPRTTKNLPQQREASEDEIDMNELEHEQRKVRQPDDGSLAIVKRLRMENVQEKLAKEPHEEKRKLAKEPHKEERAIQSHEIDLTESIFDGSTDAETVENGHDVGFHDESGPLDALQDLGSDWRESPSLKFSELQYK